jgi:membrane-bound lytic murein transglycosylase D
MFQRKLFRAVMLTLCVCIIHTGNTQYEHCDYKPATEDKSLPLKSSINIGDYTKAIQFIKAYLKKNSYDLSKLQKKSKSCFAIINSVFEKNDIPTELRYLAVVESNLNAQLINEIGATGLWQIMPVTGRELGLTISATTDERLNIYKSTKAVAKYLKQLYELYGDWLLVVAAYNSGPGYVNRAIRLSGSTDFWQLQNWLPAETRNHVKKFVSINFYFESLQAKSEEKMIAKS